MRIVASIVAVGVIVVATVICEVCDAGMALAQRAPSRKVERRSGEDRRTRLVLAKRISSIEGLDRRKGERRGAEA